MAPTMIPSTSTEDAVVRLSMDACKYIQHAFYHGSWEPELSAHELKKFRVNIRRLDLDNPGPLAMVQPVPLETMGEWLREHNPAGEHGFGYSRLKNDGFRKCAWDNADAVKIQLEGYLMHGRSVMETGIMWGQTLWRRFLDYPLMGNWTEFCYEVTSILLHENPSAPHIGGILVQDHKLRSELTKMELFNFCALTHVQIIDNQLRNKYNHKVIPVTLVSIGDCNLRILHGCVDGQRGEISIQMSKMMSFTQDGYCQSGDWMRVLSWLLAEPLSLDGRK